MDVLKSLVGPTSVEVHPEAQTNKTRLLDAVSALPKELTSTQDLQQVALVGSEIQQVLKEVEEARKVVKKPVLEAGKTVDKTADKYVAELETAIEALAAKVVQFHEKEAQRIAIEEKERTEAIARAHLEANWASEWLDPSRPPNEVEKARIAQARAKYEALLRTLPPAITKVPGVAVGERLQYRVVDKVLLYAARPDLCKIEPIPSAIRDAIFPGCNIPGLEVHTETKATFRS